MSDGALQVACFSVGGEEYALDIMRIKEIINPVKVTRVPRAPAFIEGIIELRGAFLPVVDLRKRFEVEVTDPTRDTKYVIVALEGRILGLVVDRVIEVAWIEPESIKEAPQLAVSAAARFFSGVAKWRDGIIMLIDLDELLSSVEKQELVGMHA